MECPLLYSLCIYRHPCRLYLSCTYPCVVCNLLDKKILLHPQVIIFEIVERLEICLCLCVLIL
uniref:Ovule protein n=1 Tax=Parascaris univalens TaxID=6257 RepID=A0A914ZZV0_PARUN